MFDARGLPSTEDIFDQSAATEQLPVPPLRLRRIRLHGVGPDGARFDPLDLDFTAGDAAASRVLLSLTNTGGKSTLITLVSSLVVPASRAQVGGKNLGDYVLTGDTSHVVCEWEDASTGTRTVTGAVMEWRDGRRQPSHKQRSTTNMHRAWYLFRTGPALPGIDDLPFVTDGRRVPLDSYVSAVTTLISTHPRAQGVLTRVQQEWTRALEQRTSIDPVLFSYQMRMNDAEAGAEKLLASFDSPDNVVRFFIAALNDDREIADYTGKLLPYAELAGRRPELEALAAFGTHVAPVVELIGIRHEAVEAASATALRARVAGGEHTAALRNRVTRDEKDLEDLKAAAEAAALEFVTARREYGQISDIRLQLQLEQARARLLDAVTALQDHERIATDAELQARAWDAVDTVIGVQIARTERDSAETAYATAQAGLEPVRAQVTRAAAALAGRLDSLISEADDVATTADGMAQEAEGAQRTAWDEEKAAEQRLGEAARRLKEITAKAEAAQAATDTAMAAGWLHTGEHPEHCRRRWLAAAEEAEAFVGELDEQASAAESRFDTLGAELDDVDRNLVGLRTVAGKDLAALEEFDIGIEQLGADDTVLALLGGPPAEVPDAARSGGLAQRAAAEADTRAAGHEQLARAADAELAHLDETGTAPTGPDVLAVQRVLLDEGFGAVSGLDWIERNIMDAAARQHFIAARPDVAGGVIVSDPGRFTDAVKHLGTANPRTRTPVIVTIAATTTAPDQEPARHRHVVIPHRATWDRDWAATMRIGLQADADREGQSTLRAREAAARYRTAASACSAFTSRWKDTLRVDLASRSATSTHAVDVAEQTRGQIATDRETARKTAAEFRRQREPARIKGVTAQKNADAASGLAAVVEESAAAAAQRPVVDNDRAEAQKHLIAAQRTRETAAQTIRNCVTKAAQTRAARQAWSDQRHELGIETAGTDPGGNLEVVRASWATLRNELAAAEQGMVEAEFLNRAQRQLNDAVARRDRFDKPVLDKAERLAASTAASSRETLVHAQRQARDDATRTERDRLRAEAEREQAAIAVRTAAPASGDQRNHIDLSNTPEWLPASPGDIPAVLTRLEIRNGELLERRDTAERTEGEARELCAAVASDIDALNDTIAMWSTERMPTARVFVGSKDAARTEMRDLLKAHREADATERNARDVLRDAVNAARAAAADTRWRDLDAPVAIRLRSLPEADLIAEATTLARRVRAMAESASGDLASLDTHRAILRDGLLALCREQRRLLHAVTRASRLPAGLGSFSDNAAIKIRFEEAADTEATVRLADRIDAWAIELAANPKRASSADTRARWLADAVRDTVVDRPRAGAWTIEILKPRIDGKVVYCPPDRIPQEFSGGQVLTLAVLVYCALSGVRSAHRPGGARPPGTLILDNPFGAASAEALIAMQHRLAAHTGLQLVCATGLHDAGVDAAFTGTGSVIVKLRNDGDLRRNMSFLRLRARTVDGIDLTAAIIAGRDQDSAQNWVDATRYEIRR